MTTRLVFRCICMLGADVRGVTYGVIGRPESGCQLVKKGQLQAVPCAQANGCQGQANSNTISRVQ